MDVTLFKSMDLSFPHPENALPPTESKCLVSPTDSRFEALQNEFLPMEVTDVRSIDVSVVIP